MKGLSMMGWMLVFMTASMTAAANLLLRKGIHAAGGFSTQNFASAVGNFIGLFTSPLFVIGFIFYFGAALLWFRVIASEPLSTAYPLLVSLSFLLVTAGASLFLREPFSLRIILGMMMILFGILFISQDAIVSL